MDGIHDLGGKQGFGPVKRALTRCPAGYPEAVFHARWEAAVFAMMQAAVKAGAWRNVDRFRHAIERIEPTAYLTDGYYGRWLGGIETLLIEAGLITAEEMALHLQAKGLAADLGLAARPLAEPDPQGPAPAAEGSRRELDRKPAFLRDDSVRTCQYGRSGHTRLPAYARNCPGKVVVCQGAWVFPDTNAHGQGEEPQYLYTIAFAARDLFGPEADAAQQVHLDLFEPYLVPGT